MAHRRTTLTVVVGLLVGVWITWPAAAQDEENLAENFDFEEGTAGWSVWVEDAAAGVVHADDKGEALSGKSSYLIDVRKAGGGQRVELHQNPFVIEAGTQMTFALWLKSDKVRPAKLIVNHRAAPWTSYGFKQITIQDGDWEEHWVAADVDVFDNLIGIYMELRDTKGSVWVDRVRFYEGEYVPEDGFGEPQAVDARGKLSLSWASIKARR